MALSRYSTDEVLGVGERYGVAKATNIIRTAVNDGTLSTTRVITRGAQRLDTLAGFYLESSDHWWILAATSNIGWGLQVPPGTIILVPQLSDVIALL